MKCPSIPPFFPTQSGTEPWDSYLTGGTEWVSAYMKVWTRDVWNSGIRIPSFNRVSCMHLLCAFRSGVPCGWTRRRKNRQTGCEYEKLCPALETSSWEKGHAYLKERMQIALDTWGTQRHACNGKRDLEMKLEYFLKCQNVEKGSNAEALSDLSVLDLCSNTVLFQEEKWNPELIAAFCGTGSESHSYGGYFNSGMMFSTHPSGAVSLARSAPSLRYVVSIVFDAI